MKTNNIEMNTNKWALSEIVLMGLFSALTVVGTSIRVPLPALIGNPFFHFGLPILCLAVLTLGFVKGSLAGGIGFAIFDVLNGFAAEAPYFVLESFVVGGALALAYIQFKRFKDKAWFIPMIMVFAAIAKIAMTFLKNLVVSLFMGTTLGVATAASVSALYITVINAIAAVIIVTMLYKPVSSLTNKMLKK
ncbi:ECF transporter S component [Vagococcus carniphilus]|nr:ECF transporter S component [Vagococcus carniphilus]MDT2814180.1 ECF transporter S component [Vagococcus carniphilus]MDT2864369.1 ECF transporter S component [Vagococcus carniphilus]